MSGIDGIVTKLNRALDLLNFYLEAKVANKPEASSMPDPTAAEIKLSAKNSLDVPVLNIEPSQLTAKPKRKRRTKAEMEALRAKELADKVKKNKPKTKPKKVIVIEADPDDTDDQNYDNEVTSEQVAAGVNAFLEAVPDPEDRRKRGEFINAALRSLNIYAPDEQCKVAGPDSKLTPYHRKWLRFIINRAHSMGLDQVDFNAPYDIDGEMDQEV